MYGGACADDVRVIFLFIDTCLKNSTLFESTQAARLTVLVPILTLLLLLTPPMPLLLDLSLSMKPLSKPTFRFLVLHHTINFLIFAHSPKESDLYDESFGPGGGAASAMTGVSCRQVKVIGMVGMFKHR